MADQLNTPITPLLEKNDCRQWDMTPAFLGLDAVDLKVTAGTKVNSPYLDLRNFFNYKMFVDVTNDTPTSGDFKVTLEEYAFDGSTFTLLDSSDILTAIDSATNGQKEILLFGATISEVLFSSGGGTAATIGVSPILQKYKMLFIARLVVEVTTIYVGTSASAAVRFQAGD
jgi:hypothetical protein